MPSIQTTNIRITTPANYKLEQYKKKNKLRNKSEAIERAIQTENYILNYLKTSLDKGHELQTILPALQAELNFNKLLL
jgi:hypothetical protein